MTNITTDIRWSKWVESMRKDVECTFGILKGRWRILKAGIGLDGVSVADDVWMTCCALHNMLLDIDGFSGEWKNGIPVSEWLGELGEHDDDVPIHDTSIPNAIKRLTTNLNFRNYDTSGMGVGEDVLHDTTRHDTASDESDDECDQLENKQSKNGDRVVRLLSLNFFRRKLVEHFDILFNHNQIQWPSREDGCKTIF